MAKDGARPYDACPSYTPSGGEVASGWRALAGSLPSRVSVVAVDGPAIAFWPQVVQGLGQALEEVGRAPNFLSTSAWFIPWEEVVATTSSHELLDDADFDHLASGTLADLLVHRGAPRSTEGGTTVVYGAGAALLPHDLLWYVELPKRYAEAAVASGPGTNLGQPVGTGPGTTKRLFYIDWPLLDRHRDEVVADIDCWVDVRDPTAPSFISGSALRATMAQLARQPFRTKPNFNSTPWGGHWAQRQLGHNPTGPNTALGYELIAPEAGVLIGQAGGPQVELPFQLIVSSYPEALLGAAVHSMFGTSFPVRFDYLDTAGGGNLSVHCHPREEYMRKVFGWPYTQHESYYVMVGSPDQEIFLGLRQDADVEEFEREAQVASQEGRPFDVSRYVSTFPAYQHQLFLIPGGTPHGSGRDNVVLEVSATPYLYSLRFYDWLRRDASGGFRPVHVDHAFRNLDEHRRGARVEEDLCQQPRPLRKGSGWREELLGSLEDMFFEVRRLSLRPGSVAPDDTAGRFHVLNVVEGGGLDLESSDGMVHSLAYAETLVVPAAVGRYRLRALGSEPVRVVKALVR